MDYLRVIEVFSTNRCDQTKTAKDFILQRVGQTLRDTLT